MALLRESRTTPPDGFRYTQFETQSRFTAETLGELADLIITHRVYKGLTPVDKPTVELEIQRQICEGMFPHICQPEPGENYQPLVDRSRSLNGDQIVEFTGAAFRFIGSGGAIVDKAESERRAAICRGCPYNRPSVCVCTPLHKLLDAMVPNERREPGLAICGICGCSLLAKVLLPMSTIRAEASSTRLPAHCWMKSDGQEKTT
jgi:hypothetical protein